MRPNDAYSAFAELTYPLSTDELVARIGDVELELPNGTETVREVFGRVASETYDGPQEVYTIFLSALSTKAIGRKGYSDRDPPLYKLRDREPRVVDPLLDDETRFDVDGPHCGICRHVKRVGDWDVVAYCRLKDEVVEPIVDDVCSDFVSVGWFHTEQDA